MKDPRLNKLAKLLVNYSVKLKPNEKLMVEGFGEVQDLVKEVIAEAYKAGGYPFAVLRDHSVMRAQISGASDEALKLWAKYDGYVMDDMDCYIGIRGGSNAFELSDVPSDRNDAYSTLYGYPVHHEKRVNNTKWVILRYPSPSMAQQSGMSTEAFEDFFFDVCTLDYAKMNKAMDSLKALMDKTDKVRLIAKDTDLTFSIKNIGAVKCAGECNVPDGEVYTAPVKTSVNGYITYNAPSVHSGVRYENIRLEFKDGKIVKATSDGKSEIEKVFDVDEGARYVGEFAIGVNPYVNKPMCDILFDEKIAGSIHFTPGCSYEDCSNGNISALHWDLVLIMTKDYGGGEIWFDDKLIRKDGLFVLDELKCLNPSELK